MPSMQSLKKALLAASPTAVTILQPTDNYYISNLYFLASCEYSLIVLQTNYSFFILNKKLFLATITSTNLSITPNLSIPEIFRE